MEGCWADDVAARALFPQLLATLRQLMQDQLTASGAEMRDIGALSGITESSKPI